MTRPADHATLPLAEVERLLLDCPHHGAFKCVRIYKDGHREHYWRCVKCGVEVEQIGEAS